jgi:Zn-dependent protease
VDGRTREVLALAYQVNIVLGIFNLIPVPPLDGSRIVGAILPRGLYARWSQLDQVGMLGIFALVFIFNDQFWEVFDDVLDRSTEVMVKIVGG